jgi:hypothetical protein
VREARVAIARDPEDTTARVAILDAPLAEVELVVHQAAPLQVQKTWYLQDGTVWTSDWEPLLGTSVAVGAPPLGELSCLLVPTGQGWDDVDVVLVDVRHDDPARAEEASAQRTVQLRGRHDSARVALSVSPHAPQRLRHRVITRFADGRLHRADWVHGTAAVQWVQLPLMQTSRSLRLMSKGLDFDETPKTVVALSVEGAASQSTELTFTRHGDQTWSFDAMPGAEPTVQVQVTHFPAEGSPVSLPPQPWRGTLYAVPRLGMSTHTLHILGQLLDPQVEQATATLFATAGPDTHVHTTVVGPDTSTTWPLRVPTLHGAPTFEAHVSWRLRDGTTIEGPREPLTRMALVLRTPPAG